MESSSCGYQRDHQIPSSGTIFFISVLLVAIFKSVLDMPVPLLQEVTWDPTSFHVVVIPYSVYWSCQGHCVSSLSQWRGKSKEIQTWKWLPLTFHWPELGHMTHLIPREVGKGSESVSSGRKGIKFNELLAHLLVVSWTWPFVVSTGEWMRVLGSLCSALCYPGGHI